MKQFVEAKKAHSNFPQMIFPHMHLFLSFFLSPLRFESNNSTHLREIWFQLRKMKRKSKHWITITPPTMSILFVLSFFLKISQNEVNYQLFECWNMWQSIFFDKIISMYEWIKVSFLALNRRLKCAGVRGKKKTKSIIKSTGKFFYDSNFITFNYRTHISLVSSLRMFLYTHFFRTWFIKLFFFHLSLLGDINKISSNKIMMSIIFIPRRNGKEKKEKRWECLRVRRT